MFRICGFTIPVMLIGVLFVALFFAPACYLEDDSLGGSDSGRNAPAADDDDVGGPLDDDSADDDDDDDDNDDDDNDDADCPDADEDGYEDAQCGGADCDDSDPTVHPGATDICGDEIDNDCDGAIDNPIETHPIHDEFIFGVSSGDGNLTEQLPEIGFKYYRAIINWKYVIPEVPDPELAMQDVDQAMIDDLLDNTDWSTIDIRLTRFLDIGIQPIVLVGSGFSSAYSMIDGERASPARIGAEVYLAYMYLYARAVVERYDGDGYKDAPGIVIKIWQIENELNQALLTAVWGWREPQWLEALTSPWASWAFCTRLLETLNNAVHESDPEAITTHNIHTDIHPNISELILQPSWIEAATLWRDHVDWVGFDAYPNYYMSEPVLGTVVGERVQILSDASCGKPIIAMEIGYPTGPDVLGFSAENQARFIADSIDSAIAAGVIGYFQFGLQRGDSHSVEITAQDVTNIQMIGPMFTNGDALPLFIWSLGNIDYIYDHFLDVVKAVEGYWGVIDPDDEWKPAYWVLKNRAQQIYGP